MARIPTSTGSRGASGSVNARANPGQFGAQAAGATARFARAQGASERAVTDQRRNRLNIDARADAQRAAVVQRGAEGVAGALADRMERDQEIEAKRLQSEMEVGLRSRLEELKSEVPEGGAGYTDLALKDYDERVKKTMEQTRSTFQRELLDDVFTRQREAIRTKAEGFEIEAQRAKRVADIEAIVDGEENRLIEEPGAVGNSIETTNAAIERSNLQAGTKRKLKKTAAKKLMGITIESLIQKGNLDDAEKLAGQKQVVEAIGADQTLKFRSQITAARKKLAKEAVSGEVVKSAIKGDIAVDPNDTRVKKGIDEAVKTAGVPEALTEMKPAAAGNLSLVVKNTGVFPKSALSSLNGMASNGTDEQRQFAYQTVSNILRVRPAALDGVRGGKKLREQAEQFDFLVTDAGLGAEEAIRRIKERQTPEFEKRKDVLEKAGKKLAKDNLSGADLQEEYGGFFSSPEIGSSPRRAATLEGIYRDLFVHHYTNTGYEEEAKALAIKDLKRVHNVSSVTGNSRFMRHPPEYHYPPVDGSWDYFGKQLQEAVSQQAGKEIALENIFIEATPQTSVDITAGKAPGYGVVYRVERDGIPTLEAVNGLVFRPDVKSAMEAATKRRGVEFKRLQEIERGIDDLAVSGQEFGLGDTVGASPENIEAVREDNLRAIRDATEEGGLS